MEKIKKIVLKLLLYISIIIFYLIIYSLISILYERFGTATIWSLKTKDDTYLFSSKLPGNIKKNKIEKIEKKVEIVKSKVKKQKIKDEEIIVSKNDTLINIIGLHYGKYDEKILQAVKKSNPDLNLSSLSIGQKIILPYIPEIQKDINFDMNYNETKVIEKKILIDDPIKISKVEAIKNEKWISIKGDVYNSGKADVNFLKVNVDFLDKINKIVTSSFTYVVKEKGIKSGEKKNFELVIEFLPEIAKYEIWVEYY